MMASRVLPASPLVEEEEEMTKEQKEAAISRRMEEMKRKNEMIRRRHEEVEADRRAAALAAAAQLKVAAESAAATTVTDMTRAPLPKPATTLEEPKFAPTPPTSGRGRGQRPLARRPGAPPGPSSPNKRPLDAPRARAPAGRGRGVPKERTPTTPTPGEDRKEAPADPEFNYLSDRSRQPGQPGHEDQASQESRRHAGSFGGRDFQNVKKTMANEQKRQRSEPAPRGGKPPDLTMTMTGRERQQYDSWKKERDQIDERRMSRQVDDSGEWRRAWDKEKIEIPDDEPIRRMEPAKRPEDSALLAASFKALDRFYTGYRDLAGRIGSGRFSGAPRPPATRPGSIPVKVQTGLAPRMDDISPRGRGQPLSPSRGAPALRGGRPTRGAPGGPGGPGGPPRPQRPLSTIERSAEPLPRAQRPLSMGDDFHVRREEGPVSRREEGPAGDEGSVAKRARAELPDTPSPRGRPPPIRNSLTAARRGRNGKVPVRPVPKFRPRSQEFTVIIPASPGTEHMPIVRPVDTFISGSEPDLVRNRKPELRSTTGRQQTVRHEYQMGSKSESNIDSDRRENKRNRFISESEDEDLDIEQYRLKLNHDQTGLITAAEERRKSGQLDWAAEVEHLGGEDIILDGLLRDIDPSVLNERDRREMALCGFRVPDLPRDEDNEFHGDEGGDNGAEDYDGYGYEDDAGNEVDSLTETLEHVTLEPRGDGSRGSGADDNQIYGANDDTAENSLNSDEKFNSSEMESLYDVQTPPESENAEILDLPVDNVAKTDQTSDASVPSADINGNSTISEISSS